MEKLIRYWPQLVALVAAGALYGEIRIAVAENTDARKEAQRGAVQAARVEERVEAVQEAQQRQEAALERQEALLIDILRAINSR